MQGDDIKEQIEALRQEVRGLSTSILNLRQEDMRKVFGDQFKPVLTDRIARHFSSAKKGIRKEQEKVSQVKLLELLDRAVSVFQQQGKQKTMKYLDDHEKNVRARSPEPARAEDSFELELISQIRDYLQLWDSIVSHKVPDGSSLDPMGTYSGNRALSPEAAERLLAPLSNARRVQVMLILSREKSSLAELCKALGLQKGHLQFHLKALLDVDYIAFDRKSHLYSLTSQGTIALQGVTKLVESLQPNAGRIG